MASNTPTSYRNLVIYEIYVRNHGKHGTFMDVEEDLQRIRSMGVDIVWFMPIHPIGRRNRKGSHGSPYSISDFRAVNPEYGSPVDFARLVQVAHELGMMVMIDVVYNHTAYDSNLIRLHPEYYVLDKEGNPVTLNPTWSDVIDLKHPNANLTTYLIESLQGWAKFGVDGFRCDVASLVPVSFWEAARAAVSQIKPNVIWLAESVHSAYITRRREDGLLAFSDCELYRAFDLTYDYDIWPVWQAVVRGSANLSRYLEMLRIQDGFYPVNYVKMRAVENHDNPRIIALAQSRPQALAWTAFQAFNKGAFLIYAGQESGAAHTPSLFDIDPIEWADYPLQPYLTKLALLKKETALLNGAFKLLANSPEDLDRFIQASWQESNGGLLGIFNTQNEKGMVTIQLPDGQYPDLLSGNMVQVDQGSISLPESAYILRYIGKLSFSPFQSQILDFHYTPA